ncbi:2OG-Fe(II) oxygenase (plasmid) [Mycetohabitans endofungorum]
MTLTGISRCPHFVEYRRGYGHFHWHNDYSHETSVSPRKLTVVIQLSDERDYEGGDLEVFETGPTPLPRGQGTILCFPSILPHRVTPITKGVRKVVVAWIAGPRLT